MISASLQPASLPTLSALLQHLFGEGNLLQRQYILWRWFRSVFENQSYHFMGAPSQLVNLHAELVLLVQQAAELAATLPQATIQQHRANTATTRASDFEFMNGLTTLCKQYNGQVCHLYPSEAALPALFCVRFLADRNEAAWICLLDEWLEIALDYTSITEFQSDIDYMPKAFELLMGLCEAAWLLWKKEEVEGKGEAEDEVKVKAAGKEVDKVGFKVEVEEQKRVEVQNDTASWKALLQPVFDESTIEYYRLELWQWFRYLFVPQPYSFCQNPSLLIRLHRQLGRLVAVAHSYLQHYSAALPVYDETNTDKERIRNLPELYQIYGGKLQCLSLAETQEPALFFRRFLSVKPPTDWQQLLDDWLETALSKQTVAAAISLHNLPDALELLMGLCEAGWLLWRKEEEGKAEGKVEVEVKEEGRLEEVRKDEDLQAIIAMITASMEVDAIYWLGEYALLPEALGMEYDLLVLTPNSSGRPMDELESLIRNRSEELQPVHATIVQTSKLQHWLQHGHWYWSRCCAPQKRVYHSGSTTLAPAAQIQPPTEAQMQQQYDVWQQKALAFMDGACNYDRRKEWSLATFMLHQCMEAALNALLVPLLQYRIKTHSLHKLLGMLRPLAPEIYRLFPRDTDAEIRLFQCLQKAYIHARYKDQFSVSQQQYDQLLERLSLLLDALPASFQQLLQYVQQQGRVK